jgi:hypothetical protein
MRCLRAFDGFDFVIESAGFDSPLIHLISVISCYLYAWQRHIILIIRHFSRVVPNLIRYSYNDFESVQITSSSSISSTLLIVDLTKVPISKP